MPLRRFPTFTRDLLEAVAWLKQCGIRTVAMESTSVYWIPLYQILETEGFEVFLVNAQYVKPALLTSLTSGPFRLADLGEGDLPGITTIMRRYRDLKVQLADAALLHLANREIIETVFTLDRRDFGVLRLARNRRLRIVP